MGNEIQLDRKPEPHDNGDLASETIILKSALGKYQTTKINELKEELTGLLNQNLSQNNPENVKIITDFDGKLSHYEMPKDLIIKSITDGLVKNKDLGKFNKLYLGTTKRTLSSFINQARYEFGIVKLEDSLTKQGLGQIVELLHRNRNQNEQSDFKNKRGEVVDYGELLSNIERYNNQYTDLGVKNCISINCISNVDVVRKYGFRNLIYDAVQQNQFAKVNSRNNLSASNYMEIEKLIPCGEFMRCDLNQDAIHHGKTVLTFEISGKFYSYAVPENLNFNKLKENIKAYNEKATSDKKIILHKPFQRLF